ncbi:ferredoxin [Streptoalloteichus hindustanus]|uniref:Ferredoxin n=1 Tax=Streptoalloteichus hindustanus TaxID=2017 RepID=A0A1M5BN40_STRHI|nr:ferredoxin [Streptoalloteichus hindustanus]SHF43918.1 ferredoxin [Streptoalloteichus hindustanus]
MSGQRWSVEVDREACIGSGMCAGSAPAFFELVDGRSRPLRAEVDADDEVLGVAESCPVEAILVRDVATGAQLAPEE